MTIPKGLIFYRASRHNESFPEDIKYGFYSDKMYTYIHSSQKDRCPNFRRKYQQKLIQEADIVFLEDGGKHFDILQFFSKFRGIKKCSVDPFLWVTKKETKDLGARVYSRLFKILKRIKSLTIRNLDEDKIQRNPKTFKALMLLKSLESLTFDRFLYSKNLHEPFMRVIKLASKRKNWPNFKSLKIRHFYPENYGRHINANALTECLKNLKDFMEELKSCESIYKGSSFRLLLPDCKDLLPEDVDILKEIFLNVALLEHVWVWNLSHFSEYFKMLQQSKKLKRLTLKSLDTLQEKIDLSALKNIPTFQELNLSRFNQEGLDSMLFKDLLSQVQTLKNLRVLFFEFWGPFFPLEEFKIEFSTVISSLSKLENLRFEFRGCSRQDDKPLDPLWFVGFLQAIGKRTKLKKLSLQISALEFDKSGRTFKVLCQSLKKLKQLDDLELNIDTIGDKEAFNLNKSLCKLSKLQSLDLKVNGRNLKPQTLIILLDSIGKNFPLVSELTLSFGNITISKQAFQFVCQMVHKLKCLNSMKLFIRGSLERGLNIQVLEDEMKKKLPGYIYS